MALRGGGTPHPSPLTAHPSPLTPHPSPLAPRPSHPSLDALLALDQNFVAAIEFPKKSEKKIYGECKARFEGCRRIVDLYVAKAGADAISSPYEHFLESMRTSYDVARTKALRALISKTPAFAHSSNGYRPDNHLPKCATHWIPILDTCLR